MEYTPFDLFSLLFYKYLRLMSKICGYDIFHPGFKINWLTRSFLISMCLALFSSTYTMCVYNTAQKLNAAPTIMLTMQGFLKLYTYCGHVEENRASLQILHDIYGATTDKSKQSYAIMLRWSNLIFSIAKIFSCVIVATMLVIIVYPMFVFLISGQFVPMLPMFVPGIDELSKLGFLMLTGIHTIWAVQGAVGMLFSDMFYSVMVLHIWPMVHILENMFQELNVAILKNPNLGDSLQVRLWLRNIIMAHREICLQVLLYLNQIICNNLSDLISRFISRLSDVYSRIFLFDVFSNGLAMCMILFSLSVVN